MTKIKGGCKTFSSQAVKQRGFKICQRFSQKLSKTEGVGQSIVHPPGKKKSHFPHFFNFRISSIDMNQLVQAVQISTKPGGSRKIVNKK